MSKNCFIAYASSFCNVKLLSAGLAAVITSWFYDCLFSHWPPFCVWLCSLMEYSVKQCSALSVSSSLVLLIHILCWSNWVLHVSILCAKHWLIHSSLSIVTRLVVNRTWTLSGRRACFDGLLMGTLLLKFEWSKNFCSPMGSYFFWHSKKQLQDIIELDVTPSSLPWFWVIAYECLRLRKTVLFSDFWETSLFFYTYFSK